jgi:acetyl esterase/lipase
LPDAPGAGIAVGGDSAGGLLAAVNGLQIGIVTALQDDPEGEDRITN